MSDELDYGPDPTEHTPAPSFPSLEEIASLLPQYEFYNILGVGGMGSVYLARQPALDRWVAIKLLPESASQNEEDAARFITEARSMARLTHPHIAAVYDFGQTSQGHLYLVMEFVNGLSLHELIHSEGGVATEHVHELVVQICDALDYAHGNNIVHRDIKPANILVTTDNWQTKLIDFGLANDQAVDPVQGAEYGTPDYLAPERLQQGVQGDHRADIYSLGVVIHEMFTRLTPQAADAEARKVIPQDFATVISRCTAIDPALRFQSGKEIKAYLASKRASAAPAPSAVPPPAQASPAPAIPQHLHVQPRRPQAISQSVYQQRQGVPGWIWAAASVALLGGGGWFVYSQRGAPTDRQVAVQNSTTESTQDSVAAQPAPTAAEPQPAVTDVPPGPFKPGSGTFSVLKRLKGHKELVYACGILGDQRRAVSGGHDDTLKLWDVATGVELKSFPSPVGDIHGIKVAKDGRRVLLHSLRTDQAAIFDVDEGKTLARIQAPNDRLTETAWTADETGAYLLCNAADSGVYHWDPAHDMLQALPNWPRAAYQIFTLPATGPSAQPRVLVLGSTMKPNPNFGQNSNQPLVQDKPYAALFSAPDHRHMRDLPDYTNLRNRLSLSPDGTTLMGGISTMYLLNVPALKTRTSVNAPPGTEYSASTWTAAGRLVLAGCTDGNIILMDPDSGDQLVMVNIGLRANAVSLSQDESWALVSGFPLDMKAAKPEDFEVVVVQLPAMNDLGTEKSFLATARRQLPQLATIDPELASLRGRASAADDTGYQAKVRDMATRYGSALQRAAATAAGADKAAMISEAEAIAKGGPVPDASTDASTTGDHQRLRGIYRQQILQLEPLRRDSTAKVRITLEPAINLLIQKRREAGDRLGAARCTAVLLALTYNPPPALAAATAPPTPQPTTATPTPIPAPAQPAATAPPASPLLAAKPAFAQEIKMEVMIGRPSKIKGGDFDDKMQVIAPRIKMTNTSVKQGYEGYKATFYLIGESQIDTKVVQVLQRQEFPVSIPMRQFMEKELPDVTTAYDTTGAVFGFKYEGWIVQVHGPGGELVLTKSTLPSFEKLPEQVMQLKEEMCYDRKLTPVSEPGIRRF